MNTGKQLTKVEIAKAVKQFCADTEIFINEIWVGAGTAMVMHGMREHTQDIDAGAISLTVEYCALALDKPLYAMTPEQGYLQHGYLLRCPEFDMDLHTEDDVDPAKDLVLIDGINCYSLAKLLMQKKQLNRPKDQEDIRKLEAALKL